MKNTFFSKYGTFTRSDMERVVETLESNSRVPMQYKNGIIACELAMLLSLMNKDFKFEGVNELVYIRAKKSAIKKAKEMWKDDEFMQSLDDHVECLPRVQKIIRSFRLPVRNDEATPAIEDSRWIVLDDSFMDDTAPSLSPMGMELHSRFDGHNHSLQM